VKTLATFDPFMDFNQSAFLGVAANPLVAQNRTYTRYDRIRRRAACPAIRASTRAGATSSACSEVFAEAVVAAAHCAGRTSFASRMTFPAPSEP
jgi:hypothetical protein